MTFLTSLRGELEHDAVVLVALLVLVPMGALALSIYGEIKGDRSRRHRRF